MVNKVMLIGNVGKDPAVKVTQAGTSICTFGLATTEKWSDKSGQRQEKTAWHNIVAFGKTAELVGKYVKKGSKIYVEGKLTYRAYDDRDGNNKVVTEIVANSVVFLSYPRNSGPQGGESSDVFNQDPEGRPPKTLDPAAQRDNPLINATNDDDLPF